MIVKMKKITLLVSSKQRSAFLNKLRKLGLVHIKHFSTPDAEEITVLQKQDRIIEKAISITSEHKVKRPSSVFSAQGAEVLTKAKEIVNAFSEKESALEALQSTKEKIEWYKPWGDFNIEDISALQVRGIFIRLYCLTKHEFMKLKRSKNINLIKQDAQHSYVAVIFDNPDERLAFEESTPPKMSPEVLKNKLQKLNEKIEAIDIFISSYKDAAEHFKKYLLSIKNKIRLLTVTHGMQDENAFSCLQGFCPRQDTAKVLALAKAHKAGYLVQEPDNADETPTLIKNARWVRIISPVFKLMNTLPGYAECDISPLFLVFFSLFFAMLIGDAGYGLLFLLATFLLKSKMKAASGRLFYLMCVLSTATIAWGAITGTWFGFEGIGKLPFLNNLIVTKIDSFISGNQDFMLYLCFLIGVIHLSIAHIITGVRVINSLKVIAQAGWLLILWGLFFVAGKLVIGNPMPDFAKYFLFLGAGLIIFFSNPQKNILKSALITMADLPLKIIGSFSDVVSYLRLFAVGYASVILASSFNGIAQDIGFNNVISGLIAAFILFIGHLLNIALGLMAVIVHGIRLNMLEFAGHLGMEWSGKEYRPFCEER